MYEDKYPLLCPIGDGSASLSCSCAFLVLSPFSLFPSAEPAALLVPSLEPLQLPPNRACLPLLQIPMAYPELKIPPLCFMDQHGNHAPSIFQKSNEKSQPLQPQPLPHFIVMDKGQTDPFQLVICADCLQYLTREVLLGVSTQMECSQELNPGCLRPLNNLFISQMRTARHSKSANFPELSQDPKPFA